MVFQFFAVGITSFIVIGEAHSVYSVFLRDLLDWVPFADITIMIIIYVVIKLAFDMILLKLGINKYPDLTENLCRKYFRNRG